MAWLKLPFEVMPAEINEAQFSWEEPEEVVATLATMKARRVAKKLEEERVFGSDEEEGLLVIGADTVIAVDDPPTHKATEGHRQIIGKPVDRQHAKEIIQKLAGKTHEVWTGLCLLDSDTGETIVETEKTKVEFRDMTDKLVEKYLETNEWVGKAGAYQVLGAIRPFIKLIDGSITNVIGLPMQKLVYMLEQMNVWTDENVEEIVGQKTGYRD